MLRIGKTTYCYVSQVVVDAKHGSLSPAYGAYRNYRLFCAILDSVEPDLTCKASPSCGLNALCQRGAEWVAAAVFAAGDLHE